MIELVSGEFSGTSADISALSAKVRISRGRERYVASAALRLVKAYRMMARGLASRFDFESALRTFLIVTGSSIRIPNYPLLPDNPFDLNINQNGEAYVSLEFPKYLKEKFVRDTYLLNRANKPENSETAAFTNGYIRGLSGYTRFMSAAQQLAVTGALKVPNGYTALIAMRTGGGKSLITQSVAYQHENGLTVVIVPTISLMLDQMRSARRFAKSSNADTEVMCYYSGSEVNADAVAKAIEQKEVRLLFLSPETLTKNQTLRQKIIESSINGYLTNLIVDEAHIIIEWGSSFRVDFQCLDAFRKVLLGYNPNIRTFLLSATYNSETVRALRLFYSIGGRWIELRFDRLRKEPRFDIVKCNSYYEKHAKLRELVCRLPHPMIIYVNTPSDAESIRDELLMLGYKNIKLFTGKTSSADREEIIRQWVDDDFDLMIATCAFGVGVDKKDVRTVIHLYIPSGPNQYYQECGRGGRDNLPCLSVMLYTSDDVQSAYKLSQKVLTTEKLLGRWFSMIDSSKTKKGISSTVIDTSIKPAYNEDDEFFNYVNNADVTWNVYVILLLRKNGLLAIEKVEFTNDRYLFYVKINDFSILHKSDSTTQIFDSIREKEKALISNDFESLRKALELSEKRCLSDMFTNTYKLTEEYCAGCNAHNDPVDEENSNNVIMLPVNKPLSEPSANISALTQEKNELLVLTVERLCECIEYMANSGVDVIVYFDEKDIESASLIGGKKDLLLIDYSTFFNLCNKQNFFYLSGSIAFVMRNMEAHCKRILASARRLPCKLIILSQEDIWVSGTSKRLSEIIDGPCISFSLLEKR